MRFLFVDQILALEPGRYIRGLKHVVPEDACLTRDESGHVVFPASFVGESLGQLAAWNVMFSNDFTKRPVAGIAALATVHRPVRVGETLLLESFIDSLDDNAVQYHSVARVDKEEVFVLEGSVGPLLPMSDFIDEDLIRSQFNEIYRPAEWFGVNSTKTLLLTSDNQMPHMLLAFDRILQEEPGVSMLAEKKISRAAPYFPDHFPKKPVLPMTVLLECKIDLAKHFLARAGLKKAYRIAGLRKIKMSGFIQPGDVLTCQLECRQREEQQLTLSFRSFVNDKRVCILEMLFNAMPS